MALLKEQDSITRNSVEILKMIGLTEGNVDPCFYMKQSKKERAHVALCVDDNLMIGNPEIID